MSDAEDRDLVRRARRGDVDAFTAIVDRSDRGLRALTFRLLGDRTAMDDALQETYVRAFRAIPTFRGRSAVATWLYRIAYNVCLEELRRRRRVVELPLDTAGDLRSARADTAELVAGRVDLEDALSRLPLEQRAAVLLVDAQGFDYAAAAEVLGVPRGTVASRLSHARAALREALGEHAR